MSDWQTFIPYREKWGAAVWIEIDRERVGFESDLSGPTLRPSGVHLGPVPRTVFKRAFVIGRVIRSRGPLDV